MNIGDYVRTDDGKIYKIKSFDKELMLTDNARFIGYKSYCPEIIKSSPNIIDLIEVGDYINGSKLLEIDYAENEEGNCDKIHYYYYFEDSDKDVNEYYENLEVKSIVTKEQFERMKYEVKDYER